MGKFEMKTRNVHIIWHIHQPIFVPDKELKQRVHSTYFPIIDAHIEREIPFSLNICGATLARLQRLNPEFISFLASLNDHSLASFLGSSANHAFLSWLPASSLLAQLHTDIDQKRSAGLQIESVLYPTDLCWAYRVGLAAKDSGYNTVIVSSEIRKHQRTMPGWDTYDDKLVPNPLVAPTSGETAKLILKNDAETELELLIHENSVATELRNEILSENSSVQSTVDKFVDTVDQALRYRPYEDDIVSFSEDMERFVPSKLAKLLSFYDEIEKSSISFVRLSAPLTSASSRDIGYAAACTIQGDERMWTHSLDDKWYKDHLIRVSDRVAQRINLLCPLNEFEVFIRDELLAIQDSSFFYWHFIPRSRKDFQRKLYKLEKWLDFEVSIND